MPWPRISRSVEGQATSNISDELSSLMPSARAVVVAGAAHMVVGDDNAVFMAETRGFLNSV
jgi:hypothetical protein